MMGVSNDSVPKPTGKVVEYVAGYTKYYYEDITVNNRNSIKEFEQDLDVRNQLWNTLVGDYIIDIGAGFGAYTIHALAAAAGFVFAFEHDPHIASALRHNLQNNRLLLATERATVCRWHLDDSANTIDKYLLDLSFPITRMDWIKIDLGNVPDTRLVLWGCKDTIKTYRPQILIADPEVPELSFLSSYKSMKVVNGHSLLKPIR